MLCGYGSTSEVSAGPLKHRKECPDVEWAEPMLVLKEVSYVTTF
jgi:hypothetical protein